MSASPDNRPKLRVVGALHMDEVATVQGKFVSEASNPVTWQRYVGGVGSNAARAAQALLNVKAAGCSVTLHAALGGDNGGQLLVSKIQGEGVKVVPQIAKDHATGRYSVVVDESGQLVLGLADVQLAELLLPATILSLIDPALTSTLLLDANLSPTCIEVLIEAAHRMSITVAALTVSPAKAVRLLPSADKISVLFCNRREAWALAIESKLLPRDTTAQHLPLQELANALIEVGFNDFVLTDAASPLLIRSQGVYTRVQIPPITVEHNVNGAGDTLAGASTAALTLGMPLEQAVTDYGLSLAADVLGGRRLPLPL